MKTCILTASLAAAGLASAATAGSFFSETEDNNTLALANSLGSFDQPGGSIAIQGTLVEGDVDWSTHAETYRKAIEQRLEETVLPGLGASLATSLVTTPLDFENRLLSYRGAGFSFEPVLTQSASFRPHNRSEDVQGLYLVGAGTHPGAGMPGVISSARVLDTVVPHANTFR